MDENGLAREAQGTALDAGSGEPGAASAKTGFAQQRFGDGIETGSRDARAAAPAIGLEVAALGRPAGVGAAAERAVQRRLRPLRRQAGVVPGLRDQLRTCSFDTTGRLSRVALSVFSGSLASTIST